MIEVIGKNGISAKIVLDSVSAVTGDRLTTMEITYPRFILAEFNTHRMFSRNSASSRAIPFAKMQENLTAVPVRFGQANKGMQDKGEDYKSYLDPSAIWNHSLHSSLSYSKALYDAGYHKQVYNRLTEPFQMMKTVVSATEWDNFFWLRDDEAADPSIAELARCMKQVYKPQVLQAGEWHLPYVETQIATNGDNIYIIDFSASTCDPVCVSLEDAIKVSCARACAVSFRKTDYGLDKSREVFERLVGDERKHSSAMEHCASVMSDDVSFDTEGVTSRHKVLGWMSGNLSGFIQYRQLIEGHTKWGV
jgi:thymidylate synthase ThyX